MPAIRRTIEACIPLAKIGAIPYNVRMKSHMFKLLVALLLSGILLGGSATAQQHAELPPGWTQEKCETLEKLRKEIRSLPQNMRGDLKDIDPMLVGKSIVFSQEWLKYVGPGKPLTKQHFEIWRNKMDALFALYADLTGGPPPSGEKVFVNIQPGSHFQRGAAHAHREANIICFNPDFKNDFKFELNEIAKHNSWTFTMMHELAHTFSTSKPWGGGINAESVTDLFIAYAMENGRAVQYGTPGERGFYMQPTSGTAHRKRIYNRALDKLRTNKTDGFNGTGSVYDLYAHGLVDKVGWDVFKQAFRSYNDKTFPQKTAKDKGAKARDFFDRIEHFSGKPGILRTLPDKGAFLDKYMSVEMVEQNLGSKTNGNIAVQSSPAPPQSESVPPTMQRAPVSGGRRYVNEEIEKLNAK